MTSILDTARTGRFLPAVAGLLGCLLLPAIAGAATYNVPADFPTIQEAIDAPGVLDGDTITVDAGTYSNPPATGFGPQNYAMNINKELTIEGAGSDAAGTVFAPYSAGGQITNGAIFISASNVTLRGMLIDGQLNQDSGTGQEVARGIQTQGVISNLLFEDLTIVGTTHSCIEANNTVDSTIRNCTLDQTVAGYNVGAHARGLRIVDNDNLLIENVQVLGPADPPFGGPGNGYYAVSFQGNNSYTLRDVDFTGGTTDYGQYIYAGPVFYCCDPGTQEIAYEGSVAIEDTPIGIWVRDFDPAPYTAAEFAVTLTAEPGVVTFANVETPLLRTGLGQVDELETFVCNVDIPHRLTNAPEERYYASNADALAAQAALGGDVDEILCPVAGIIDLRPNNERNQVNTGSKQLVPVALLGSADFDPCDPLTGIDDASVLARGASPATSRTRCRDENRDGFVDMVVYFSARDLEDPSEAECADPDARFELTASTLDGRSYSGSDRVDWLNCD